MRYPGHIILDTQVRFETAAPYSWQGEFTRVTSLNKSLGSNTVPLNNLIFSHTALKSKTRTNDLGKIRNLSQSAATSIFDIHFLRKEKLYTKLKYSRCPQYDIVSGEFAALLAGFIGFVISEKFGIELVDSGDFYTALMYVVFASFSVRPLIRIYSEDNTPYSPISLKYASMFFRDILILIIRWFRTVSLTTLISLTGGLGRLTTLLNKNLWWKEFTARLLDFMPQWRK